MKEIKYCLFCERIIISEPFCTVGITPTSLVLSFLPANNSAILVQCFIAGLISVPLPGYAALRPRRSFSSHQGKEAEVRKDNTQGKKYRRGTCLNWETCCFYGIPSFWKSSLKPSKHRRVVLETHFWKIFESSLFVLYFHVYFPPQVVQRFLGQMVDALFYIHKQNIWHRWAEISFPVWKALVLCTVLRGREFYSSKRSRGEKFRL